MLYAILCYNSEEIVESWTKEEDDAVMARLDAVHQKLISQGRFGPTARLMPTTTATSLRKGKEPLITDGPFVETKEQLLGFYLVECETLEDAIAVAKDLAKANPGAGGYEIRPTRVYVPSSMP
jgi:hypothetical protein